MEKRAMYKYMLKLDAQFQQIVYFLYCYKVNNISVYLHIRVCVFVCAGGGGELCQWEWADGLILLWLY